MAAPKGNKFAKGNKGGQPPVFKNADELQSKINSYFTDCPDKKTFITKDGDTIEIPAITVCGLAEHLGFESRQSMYDYEKKEEYSYIIKRARLKVEKNYEQNLQYKDATGSIFALKNMGWKDKTETELTGKDGSALIPIRGITFDAE